MVVELLEREQLDALLFAGNDHRGHKGALRWVSGFDLPHKRGFAVARRDSPETVAVLPASLAEADPRGATVPLRFAVDVPREIAAVVGRRPRRVGIVGLGEIARVTDVNRLRALWDGVELCDMSGEFDRLRARKSEEERDGIREAMAIARTCHERLERIAAPGASEGELCAELLAVAYAAGGRDMLFLTYTAACGSDGGLVARYGPPGDRRLAAGDQLVFSLELVGPAGYWCELARPIILGPSSRGQRAMATALDAALTAGATALRPGRAPAAVQDAVATAARAHGMRAGTTSGHAIGLDVIERPMLGTGPQPGPAVADGGVFAVHPSLVCDASGEVGYAADCFVVGCPEPLSGLGSVAR